MDNSEHHFLTACGKHFKGRPGFQVLKTRQ